MGLPGCLRPRWPRSLRLFPLTRNFSRATLAIQHRVDERLLAIKHRNASHSYFPLGPICTSEAAPKAWRGGAPSLHAFGAGGFYDAASNPPVLPVLRIPNNFPALEENLPVIVLGDLFLLAICAGATSMTPLPALATPNKWTQTLTRGRVPWS